MKTKSPFKKEPKQLGLREQLGLRLEDIAGFCGVKISTLGMMEAGKRSLPWKSNNHFLQLQLAWVQAREEPLLESELPALSEDERKKIGKEMERLELDRQKTRKKLEKMKFQFGQAKVLLKTSQRLEPQFQEEDSMEMLCISYWKRLAADRLQKFGPRAQKRLQFQIEEINRKREMLNELLK